MPFANFAKLLSHEDFQVHGTCMHTYIHTYNIYIYTRIFKIFIKNFKGLRNVQKYIETSDDISIATMNHHILRGSDFLNPVE